MYTKCTQSEKEADTRRLAVDLSPADVEVLQGGYSLDMNSNIATNKVFTDSSRQSSRPSAKCEYLFVARDWRELTPTTTSVNKHL